MTLVFNVRVYGILIKDNTVLVSDEMHAGRSITKFPGGGLQFGEGTHECLKREFMEELQMEISIVKHFYTVDFFQASAFDASQQVISIYYLVKNESGKQIQQNAEYDEHTLRWVPLQSIIPTEFTFPIDQKVAELLGENFRAGKKPPS